MYILARNYVQHYYILNCIHLLMCSIPAMYIAGKQKQIFNNVFEKVIISPIHLLQCLPLAEIMSKHARVAQQVQTIKETRNNRNRK